MEYAKNHPDYIACLLIHNDLAVERAVLAIYARQTASEKAHGTTHESNGRGFSAFDAKRGAYFATWLLRGNRLTGKFLVQARVMMRKYVKQLAEIATEKMEIEAAAQEIERATLEAEREAIEADCEYSLQEMCE